MSKYTAQVLRNLATWKTSLSPTVGEVAEEALKLRAAIERAIDYLTMSVSAYETKYDVKHPNMGPDPIEILIAALNVQPDEVYGFQSAPPLRMKGQSQIARETILELREEIRRLERERDNAFSAQQRQAEKQTSKDDRIFKDQERAIKGYEDYIKNLKARLLPYLATMYGKDLSLKILDGAASPEPVATHKFLIEQLEKKTRKAFEAVVDRDKKLAELQNGPNDKARILKLETDLTAARTETERIHKAFTNLSDILLVREKNIETLRKQLEDANNSDAITELKTDIVVALRSDVEKLKSDVENVLKLARTNKNMADLRLTEKNSTAQAYSQTLKEAQARLTDVQEQCKLHVREIAQLSLKVQMMNERSRTCDLLQQTLRQMERDYDAIKKDCVRFEEEKLAAVRLHEDYVRRTDETLRKAREETRTIEGLQERLNDLSGLNVKQGTSIAVLQKTVQDLRADIRRLTSDLAGSRTQETATRLELKTVRQTLEDLRKTSQVNPSTRANLVSGRYCV